eukprot:COSAG01_NODE_720_length_14070_cov_9.960633_11_plen_91_part_00
MAVRPLAGGRGRRCPCLDTASEILTRNAFLADGTMDDRNFVASEHFRTGNFQHARDLKLKAVRDAIWELAFGVTRQVSHLCACVGPPCLR